MSDDDFDLDDDIVDSDESLDLKEPKCSMPGADRRRMLEDKLEAIRLKKLTQDFDFDFD